ncbi:hypothetical protein BP6252_03775 [Coleophoma cylindrospora]|uniref:Uncharacterized protein n=1 Tax=Coleophoma cylindrospora TaxID=1849047 RepID=A0A3D8S8P3_9HELO|nr:hypothetical protein BP6252_03775 [Coleophoma cylindrospora]
MASNEETPLRASTKAVNDKSTPITKSWFSSILYPFSALKKQAGFKKTSSFVYFSITAGLFFAFCLSKVDSLDHERWLKGVFFHRFWFSDGAMAVFIQIHLRTVIPCGLMMPIQFIPAIRQKYPRFHRYVGRLNLILLTVGSITAISVAPRSFGGALETQILVWVVSSLVIYSICRSWAGMRNLRIDEHRAWILRTWAYAGSVFTLRVCMMIFGIGVQYFSANQYRTVTTCQEVLYLYETLNSSVAPVYAKYPVCTNVTSAMRALPMVDVVVTPAFGGGVEQRIAMLNLNFGVAGWAALLLHGAAVEIYLNATKDEDARLKKVSAMRRKAAGLEGAKEE